MHLCQHCADGHPERTDLAYRELALLRSTGVHLLTRAEKAEARITELEAAILEVAKIPGQDVAKLPHQSFMSMMKLTGLLLASDSISEPHEAITTISNDSDGMTSKPALETITRSHGIECPCPSCVAQTKALADGADPLEELAKLIDEAGGVMYIHYKDCAMWNTPPQPCDKECGKKAYAQRDNARINDPEAKPPLTVGKHKEIVDVLVSYRAALVNQKHMSAPKNSWPGIERKIDQIDKLVKELE